MEEKNTQNQEAKVKEAKIQVTLEDIKFNEENKALAILACIPLIGLIMFFAKSDDLFVRYTGAQYALLGIVPIIFVPLLAIPFINFIAICMIPTSGIVLAILVIIGMIKSSQGARFDVPGISSIAIKLMNSI